MRSSTASSFLEEKYVSALRQVEGSEWVERGQWGERVGARLSPGVYVALATLTSVGFLAGRDRKSQDIRRRGIRVSFYFKSFILAAALRMSC